ncbi:APC family permease [Leucobacter iarius]|uniref:APC family permease n=1 Tax=Leucobacter iarius TaxID=333963 RepID=A0ABN2L989_9MICO
MSVQEELLDPGAPVATGASATPGRLTGRLGPIAIVFMVVAAAAPLTILVSAPTNMLNGNGAGMAAIYFIAPMLLMLFAPGFAAMTRYVPKAGAFYSYVTAGFGRDVGVGAGFVAIAGYLVFQSFVYTLMAMTITDTLAGFFGDDAPRLPWFVWVFVMIAIVGVLGVSNIDVNAKVLSVVLIVEVLTIIVMNVAVIVRGGTPSEGVSLFAGLTPDVLFSAPLAISLLIGFSVGLGFEATAIFRDEARDPERTIPRAIYITLGSAAVFYSFAVWGFVQGWGTHGVMRALRADPALQFSIVYETGARYVGPVFSQIMQVVALTSMFACVLAYHNIAARYLHSMGHSVLPQRLTAVHPKSGAPFIASVATSAVGVVAILLWMLSGLEPATFIGWEVAVGTLAILMVFVLTSAAIFVYFRRNPAKRGNAWVSTVSPVLAFVVLGSIMLTAMFNFGSLSGAVDSPALNIVLELVPVAMFAAGVVAAKIAKRRSPERYAGLVHHE